MKKIQMIIAMSLFVLAGCGGVSGDLQDAFQDHSTRPPASGSPSAPSSSGSTAIPVLNSLEIKPSFLVVTGLGTTAALTVDARCSNGTVLQNQTRHMKLTDADGSTMAEWDIVWSTENFGIATVDENGFLTAVSSGETTITAKAGDRKATARVVVESETSTDPNTNGSETPPVEGLTESPPPTPEASYPASVVWFRKGENGGFNEDKLPGIVLGPPKGAGLVMGSFDVFSLGKGGEIVLEFSDYVAFDGEGADFTVFENAFQVAGGPMTFAEPGIVGVSNDGVRFVEFPCDLSVWPYVGCAGVHPVFANPDLNRISPIDPTVSGGDSFDLATVGMQSARFVRIRDANVLEGAIYTNNFDLDAVAIVHGAISPRPPCLGRECLRQPRAPFD